jgi:hypothetical protein
MKDMTHKLYPPDILTQAQDVRLGWQQVNEELTFGEVTPASLAEDLNAASPLNALIRGLDMQLADKKDQRDNLYNSMWDKIKRIRAGFKANYGDDSQQFETVGGTRMSDRKPRARKNTAAGPTA